MRRLLPDKKQYFPVLNLRRVGVQVDTNGCPHRFSGHVVENATMLWALDRVVHHKPVSQMNAFMCAETIRREIAIIGAAVYREGAPRMIEPDHTLSLETARLANLYPAHCALISVDAQ